MANKRQKITSCESDHELQASNEGTSTLSASRRTSPRLKMAKSPNQNEGDSDDEDSNDEDSDYKHSNDEDSDGGGKDKMRQKKYDVIAISKNEKKSSNGRRRIDPASVFVRRDEPNFDILSLVPPNVIPCLYLNTLAFREGTIDPKRGKLKRGKMYPITR
ncbi:4127_t:CDS:2 [Paraglomus brasilianum]|uniref:4127_t:CDS:1 n=1 Tax=Paraglomus brasilianum TaxID=144538 RepID=A0A9N9AJR7_9GLOM|nr:4127_t:CDS:2 [Paraglomus brasilianum]